MVKSPTTGGSLAKIFYNMGASLTGAGLFEKPRIAMSKKDLAAQTVH